MMAKQAPRLPRTKSTGKGLSIALLGVGVGAAAGSLFAGSVSALAAYFARRVVTPNAVPEESLAILAVVPTDEGQDIILPANKDSTAPGRYSLFFSADRGHARLGEPKGYRTGDGTVTRPVEEVYSGDLSAAVRGRLSGVVFNSPADVGVEYTEIEIPTENGGAPAWFVAGTDRADTWAICVHGRGANRKEGIRALPTLGELGLSALLVSYRNDGVAPAAVDGRYGLGATEWPDVDAAIDYALSEGAREIMLFGWSMGGAVGLQAADRSGNARSISAMVLDGPVINWIDVLSHQAKLNRIPEAVGTVRPMAAQQQGRPVDDGVGRAAGPQGTELGRTARPAAHPDAHHAQRGRRLRAHRPLGATGRAQPGNGGPEAVHPGGPHPRMERRSRTLGPGGQGIRGRGAELDPARGARRSGRLVVGDVRELGVGQALQVRRRQLDVQPAVPARNVDGFMGHRA